jgi:hypothetical protein
MGSNPLGSAKHISDHTSLEGHESIHEAIHHGERPDLSTRLVTRTNTYAFFEAATHHERPLNSGNTWACLATGLWVMGGIETARGPEIDITLNEMFCGNSVNERYHITGIPVFTATPRTAAPVLLTTSHVVQEAGTTPSTTLDGVNMDAILEGRVTLRPPLGTVKVLNVRVRVHCWQANGQPVSGVEFSWTCLAEGVITTIR